MVAQTCLTCQKFGIKKPYLVQDSIMEEVVKFPPLPVTEIIGTLRLEENILQAMAVIGHQGL